MRIEIPGYKTMDLKYLILDYNGTIAKDGIIPESVKERLKKLSGIYEIYVLTADTHGTPCRHKKRAGVNYSKLSFMPLC